MKNLRRLGAAVVLTFVLGLSALTGEVETPPAPSAQATSPGAMGTPTLSSMAPGQTDTPPSSHISLGEIAASVLWNLLPLF